MTPRREDQDEEIETTMPDKRAEDSSGGGALKELGKYGIPAGLIVAIIATIQFLGIPYGEQAQKEKTDLALTIAEIRTDLRNLKDKDIPGVRTEVQDLRSDLASQNQHYVVLSAFKLWVYKLQVENRAKDISIPDYE
jgi:hypothetical protein